MCDMYVTGVTKYFPAPNLSHLNYPTYDKIYDPSEETYLFMDALQKDFDVINMVAPDVCLEVGCGSGALITFLASMFPSRPVFSLATDINMTALEVSEETGSVNGLPVCGVCTDLATCLEPRLQGLVDIILFNPPYIVSDPDIIGRLDEESRLAASWAGGRNGREVMDRFFPSLPHLLSPRGLFYLAAIDDNDITDIEKIMVKLGFCMETILTSASYIDGPSVLRFQRPEFR